jgi:hypothetical protein
MKNKITHNGLLWKAVLKIARVSFQMLPRHEARAAMVRQVRIMRADYAWEALKREGKAL